MSVRPLSTGQPLQPLQKHFRDLECLAVVVLFVVLSQLFMAHHPLLGLTNDDLENIHA